MKNYPKMKNHLKIKNRFRFPVSTILGILLFSIIIQYPHTLAQTEPEKNIDYYLGEDKIEEFNQLDTETETTILQSADERKSSELLTKVTQDIFQRKALSASGFIAEGKGEITDIGRKNANYPAELKFVGFGNSNLMFYGEEGKKVIGDGETFLPLENIPAYIKEIEYIPKKSAEDSARFILKGQDNQKIILKIGGINEKGEIDILSITEGKAGNERFSLNLNDYEFKGEVSIDYLGFRLENKDSEATYNDLTFKRIEGLSYGSVEFTKVGVDLWGASVFKKGKYKIEPSRDLRFKVVFGDDWSTFLGKDYPDSISLNDVEMQSKWVDEYASAGTMAPAVKTGRRTQVNSQKEYGEINILPGENGEVFQFEKNGQRINLKDMKIDELENSQVYKSSGETMRGIMKSIVENPENGQMGFVQKEIYNDNAIVSENTELYKEFLADANLNDAPAGIAISSERSDGKIDVLANPKNVGAQATFYNNLGTLSVAKSSSKFEIDINPSKDEGIDFTFRMGDIYKLGPVSKFEHSIDEIRLLDSTGEFNLQKLYAIKEGENKKLKLVAGDKVTVFKGVFNPLSDSLVLGNGEVSLNNLGLPVEEYIRGIETALDAVKKSEGDIKEVTDWMRTKLQEYETKTSPEEKTKLQNEMNSYLKKRGFKEIDFLGPGWKDIATRSVALKVAETSLSDLRQGIEQDLQTLKTNPFVGDVKITVDREDALYFDTSNIENFPDAMAESDFEIDIGIKLPDFKAIETLMEKQPLLNYKLGSKIDSATVGMAEMQRKLLDNGITQFIVQGLLSQQVTKPSNTWETNLLYKHHTSLEKLTLQKPYAQDLSKAITRAMGRTSLQGDSHLIMKNNPSNNDLTIEFKSGGKTIPLDLQPETRQFIRDSLILGFNAPDLSLRGYSNVPFLRGYNDVPLVSKTPLYLRNAAVIPNPVFQNFCGSVGYSSGFCGWESRNRLEAYLNEYWRQKK